MDNVRWGIIGCGDVTEVKSGPGFQKADGSSLVAVMRRDRAKAEDYARRHGVGRVHATAADLDRRSRSRRRLHRDTARHPRAARAARGGRGQALPRRETNGAHPRRVPADGRRVPRPPACPLWVAYYRRALPRFLKVRELLSAGAIGRLTSVHIQVTDRLAAGADATNWRFDPAQAGAGLFLDLASHCLDLVDFLVAPIAGRERLCPQHRRDLCRGRRHVRRLSLRHERRGDRRLELPRRREDRRDGLHRIGRHADDPGLR